MPLKRVKKRNVSGVDATTRGSRMHPGQQALRKSRLAVGLISGTSADGIDAALVRLEGPPENVSIRLVEFTTVPYPPAVRARILRVAGDEAIAAREVSDLNFLLGEL